MGEVDASMFPNWLIFLFAALSVFGSVMWIKPSPRQQEIARIRQQALLLGIRVQLSKFKGDPKRSGVREEIECVAYCKDDVKRKQEVPVWCVGKSEGWDSTGLPEGWYWYIAPKQTDSLLAHINTMIKSLPDSAVGIERTQGRRLIYWHEKGGDEALKAVDVALDRM